MEGHNFRKEIIVKLHKVRIDLFSNSYEDFYQNLPRKIESLDRFHRDHEAAAPWVGGGDVNKKLLKIRKSCEEVEVDCDCVDGVIDELKKAKDRLVAFVKNAAAN